MGLGDPGPTAYQGRRAQKTVPTNVLAGCFMVTVSGSANLARPQTQLGSSLFTISPPSF